jgi:hypothetical protein
MDAYCLIDWDNLSDRKLSHGIVALAHSIFNIASRIDPALDDVILRCYGGWYDAAGLTRRGTRLAQAIQSAFPIIKRQGTTLKYVKATLASSNLDTPIVVFDQTVRQRGGLPNLWRGAIACSVPANCSVNTVISWSRYKKCPEQPCAVLTSQAFQRHEQKLVDTLLTTDILSLSRDNAPFTVFVATDDDDMVPPMLVGATWGGRIVQLRESGRRRAYDHHLTSSGVQIQLW